MHTRWIAAAVMSIAAGVTLAKLPGPTPEQLQAAEAKKETDKAAAEIEKQQLEKAQDRVAAYYKRTKGGAPGAARTGQTDANTLPNPSVRKAQGDAGPTGGTKQSAEAHSAPAK